MKQENQYHVLLLVLRKSISKEENEARWENKRQEATWKNVWGKGGKQGDGCWAKRDWGRVVPDWR